MNGAARLAHPGDFSSATVYRTIARDRASDGQPR
jgi:hypothetical protein